MARKNRDYWRKRSEQVQESLLNKSDVYAADLEKQYKLAMTEIQKEIEVWYKRFAKNNCISYAEAKRLLNTNELKEFRWNVEEYIKYGQKNAVHQYWMEELENASAKVHITRLEALKLQVQQHVETLIGNQLDDTDNLIRNLYKETYYRNAFELQKGFNTGFSFAAFNENELDKVLAKPWTSDGVEFSKRIWGEYRPQLVETLHTQLTQTLIQGKTPDKAIQVIANKFNTTRKKASNLVMTESAYFSSLSRNDCYKDLGIEEFENVATLDTKTSNTCQSMDGTHFPLTEYEVHVTAPPFHNYCRTTTCPYFNDEFTLGEKRTARSLNDKTEYIPSNIKYPEWKKKYVKDGNSDIIKEKNIKDSKFKANREYINSEEYEPKFDNMGSKKQNKAVFKETKKLIKDNDMKNTEGVSIIDGKGNIIYTQKTGSYGGSVDLSCLDGLPNNSVILTHNHPLSTSFSDDDLALLMDNPQIKTIIAGGHNGIVYKLSVGKGIRTEISKVTGRNSIMQEYSELSSVGKTPNEIVEMLSKIYGWKYEVI